MDSETLSGTVERITYNNADNGYTVLKITPDKKLPQTRGGKIETLATVVGNLPDVNAGEYLVLTGKWVKHPQHGLQFMAQQCEKKLPASIDGIRRYLGSGLIKGIGGRLANRIVDQFGLQTLDVIQSAPERLREVPDIGSKRVSMILQAWEEQKQVQEIMLFLHSHQVSTSLAVKIFKQYGAQAITTVKTNPYQLAQDIYGVGFKTADKLAQSLGLPFDHPARIEAGLVYTLNQMSNEGHVYSPLDNLTQKTAALLEVAGDLIPPAIDRLARQNRIQVDTVSLATSGQPSSAPVIYLKPFYLAEVNVARCVVQLAGSSARLAAAQKELPGLDLLTLLGAQLSEEQRTAVATALSTPFSILTGGPGTGKTFTIKTLVDIANKLHRRVALAAPTGRAAKRLSEASGYPAGTIHRLLGYSPESGFQHHQENPLAVDLLVVDETSMLDILLANALFKAVAPGTHLLMVGDVDQLPSVGAGDVLRDLIDSQAAPVTRLTQIFRQAAQSQIIHNAHRINQGQTPQFDPEAKDFFFFPAADPDEAGKWVEDLVCERIPRKFDLKPHAIQVLSPQYRGAAGVDALNQRLQLKLNPPSATKPEKALFGQIFRLHDRVMQIQNNYDKNTFNGDIGRIIHLSIEDQTLVIDFEGNQVEYMWNEADQLVLAYAVSVHKAQGSEFPAVVIPLLTQHYMMLQRNLLYTAITRASQLCVLVGERRAIAIAVRNNKVAQRFSALDYRVAQALR